jgi:hypothetical protein
VKMYEELTDRDSQSLADDALHTREGSNDDVMIESEELETPTGDESGPQTTTILRRRV